MQWLTTSPNPRSADTGFDAGQRGWRLHAVEIKEGSEHKRPPSLCGIRPRYGWGLDLFIEEKCARCLAILKKRNGV